MSTPGGALAVLAHGGSHGSGSVAATWLLPVLITAVLGAGYLAGVVRLRGSGRRWSGGRTASFLLGAGLVGAALSPAVDAATAGGHMVQHLLLGMFAPVALVLGAPLTLLLAGLPVSARRPVVLVLRSRALHALSSVATAAVLSVGGLYLLYLTPLYALSSRSEVVHHLMQLHFLLAGYLFAWAVAGPDPAPRRPSMAVRLVVLVLAGGAHAFLAKLLYSRAPVLPAGGGHDAAEVEAAAQLMYYGGHVADLLLLVALFAAWYRRTGRALARGRAAAPGKFPPECASAATRVRSGAPLTSEGNGCPVRVSDDGAQAPQPATGGGGAARDRRGGEGGFGSGSDMQGCGSGRGDLGQRGSFGDWKRDGEPAEPALSGRASRPDTVGRRQREGSPRAGTRRTRADSSHVPGTRVESMQGPASGARSRSERWGTAFDRGIRVPSLSTVRGREGR